MKKILILIICLLGICINLNSQINYNYRIFSNEQKNPKFTLTFSGFSNTQNPEKDFIVFEFDSIKANILQESVISTLSTIYKSPKDVIHPIGSNIISVDGYATRVFTSKDGYYCDIEYTLIIEFKDGKIRYNSPIIKMIFIDSEFMGKMKIKESSFFSIICESPDQDNRVASYFNSIIFKINDSIKKTGNDW